MIGDRPIWLEVDGGITPETAPLCSRGRSRRLRRRLRRFRGGADGLRRATSPRSAPPAAEGRQPRSLCRPVMTRDNLRQNADVAADALGAAR